MTPVPESLRWMRGDPEAAAWLASVPDRLARCAAHWHLTLGPAFPSSHVSWTCAAVRADGEELVLKLQFPHDECVHEAEALRRWDGRGAVRLVAHAPEDHALLLERCLPGGHLSGRPRDEALSVLGDLLPQLWVPADRPFTTLAEEAAGWAEEIPRAYARAGRPFEPRLVELALDLLRTLPQDRTESVLLHQDLHADNVLDAGEGHWLAIDPKPLVGERAFGLAPILRSYELGHSREAVLRRLSLLTERLGLDRERVRGWAIAQTIAWCFAGDRAIPQHVESARWLAEA